MAPKKMFVDIFGNAEDRKKLIKVALTDYIKPNLTALSTGLRDGYIDLVSNGITDLEDWSDFVIKALSEMYSDGFLLRLPDVESLKEIANAPTLKQKVIETGKLAGKVMGNTGFRLFLYLSATLLGSYLAQFFT